MPEQEQGLSTGTRLQCDDCGGIVMVVTQMDDDGLFIACVGCAHGWRWPTVNLKTHGRERVVVDNEWFGDPGNA